jgi:protein-S-isoprenylcysteine O-methyltransferase Ste14
LARWLLIGVSLVGWAMVFSGSFLIDHFDLFGLRQVWVHLRQRAYHHPPFMVRSLYKFVRHPLMVGFIIAFWATPDMTAGHLLFAGVTTAYILFGIKIEERDLVRFLGDDYREYRKRTPALVPFTKGGRPSPSTSGAASEGQVPTS